MKAKRWPPWSPEYTTLYFFFWDHVKSEIGYLTIEPSNHRKSRNDKQIARLDQKLEEYRNEIESYGSIRRRAYRAVSHLSKYNSIYCIQHENLKRRIKYKSCILLNWKPIITFEASCTNCHKNPLPDVMRDQKSSNWYFNQSNLEIIYRVLQFFENERSLRKQLMPVE